MKSTKTILNFTILISASTIGFGAVMYGQLIDYLQKIFFTNFNKAPILTSCLMPLIFILSAWIVKRFAPEAKGSGIPQVLGTIEESQVHVNQDKYSWQNPLISMKTAITKIISTCLGVVGGASIGCEGPTVQIAAAIFIWIGNKFRKFHPHIEFNGLLIAGASAGLAAAFNTPIAGVAFAIEELGCKSFNVVRKFLLISIIFSGLVAQFFQGNRTYFGITNIIYSTKGLLLQEAIALGIIGGLLGGLFAKILANPNIIKLPKNWLFRAFLTGIICAIIGYFNDASTAGSGYDIIKDALLTKGTQGNTPIFFPFYKIITTILSCLSGMAGGIFSPSLSIGAGLGLSFSHIFGLANFRACAFLGMAAFFSGTVGAPFTAVVIIIEMSDKYTLALPLLITSYLAFSMGKLIMPESLYQYLLKKNLGS